MKMVIVSAVTAIVVLVLVAVVGLGVYYFFLREQPTSTANGQPPESITDKLRRTAGISSTDASNITSISLSEWSHAGPLYPAANEPPGYVISSGVSFSRDLTATKASTKDYDRDLPDESKRANATLTDEQFKELAEICAKNDILSQPDATGNRSESGKTLTIVHGGETKKLVVSDSGKDSAAVAEVIEAISRLQNSIKWTDESAQNGTGYNSSEQTADIATLKEFAERYQPRSGREVIPSPPVLNEKLLTIIERLARAESRDHEKYVVLIFLRLSRFHVENFKQHYELGRENPLTKEFYRLIGRESSISREFMPSSLADDYVASQPELLKYSLIDGEMKRIKKAGNRIQDTLRWKQE